MKLFVEEYQKEKAQDMGARLAQLFFFFEDQLENIPQEIEGLVQMTPFKGKSGQLETFIGSKGQENYYYMLAGLGKKEKAKEEAYKKALSLAVKEAIKRKAQGLHFKVSPQEIKEEGIFPDYYTINRTFTETALLAAYKFDKYKSKEEENEKEDFLFFLESQDQAGIEEGRILAQATILARNLINEPSNVMTPSLLAQEAQKAGQEAGFEVQVMARKEIEKLEMGAFLAVANGSQEEPALIVLRYMNAPDQEEINGIVGKGLVFDSGGLSIKPSNSMLDMKSDMSGAAATIGAFTAIAKADLKINVVGVIAACENMISGKSYRPGDIIKSMSGKTIFIGNTDAEGRLTLADAITYIIEKEKVDNLVDIATLTGAAVVALGDTTTAVISNNDQLFAQIEKASQEADERIWRLPSFDDYREKIKAKEADLTNSAGNPGTITAGLFLEAFVADKPWVHLDIAGTSWTEKAYDYYSPGGTGYGVRTLYHWLKNKSQE